MEIDDTISRINAKKIPIVAYSTVYQPPKYIKDYTDKEIEVELERRKLAKISKDSVLSFFKNLPETIRINDIGHMQDLALIGLRYVKGEII